MTDTKVHHQTERGARIALSEARELGRYRGPDDTGQASNGRKGATERPPEGRERPQEGTGACLCGCGEPVKNRFRPGHDMRLYGELKRNLEKDPLLRNERFTDEQKAYAKERGLV